MQNLKILHLIDSMGIGGAQTMMFELYNGFKRYYPEIEQTVFLLNPDKVENGFAKANGVPYQVKTMKDLAKFTESYDSTYIALYHKLMKSDTRQIARLNKKISRIAINHTFTSETSVDDSTITSMDGIVYVSHQMYKKLYFKFNHSYENVEIIRNGVDGTRYLDIKADKRKDVPKDVFLTGRVNKFNSIKHSQKWLEWINNLRLPKRIGHVYIGDGPSFLEAKSWIKRNAISWKSPNPIILTDKIVSFRDKISLMKSWEVFLYGMPNHAKEGISISVLEALACGIPVICSNNHSNIEIIKNGVNGYVFNNHQHAEEILRDLILNPDKLKELKNSTIEHFNQNLDIKYVCKNYLDFMIKVKNKKDQLL